MSFFGMGPMELLMIVVVLLLLFGAKRIPEIAQGMGKGIREFKRAMKDVTDEVKGSPDALPPYNSGSQHQKEEKPH